MSRIFSFARSYAGSIAFAARYPSPKLTTASKKTILLKQGYVCNSCKKPTKLWDFHHKDGKSSNNQSWNCEALCPNCHAEKTRN